MRTALVLCALACNSFAGEPILTRITLEALARLQQTSPMTRLEPAKRQAAADSQDQQSIIKQSVILHDGSNWTLVPKGAVIFLPEAMKGRVNAKPVGTLVSWIDFLTQNRAWIITNDVTFDQAAGSKPLPAERLNFWAKQDKVVIAVHQNGPISVRVANENQTITKR